MSDHLRFLANRPFTDADLDRIKSIVENDRREVVAVVNALIANTTQLYLDHAEALAKKDEEHEIMVSDLKDEVADLSDTRARLRDALMKVVEIAQEAL